MPLQLEVFPDSIERRGTKAEYGTFKDSLRAPIHRWFQYPAGYSYKFIEAKFQDYILDEKAWVLDPFVGCGTTSIVAKMKAINSIGVEAHPFVCQVARTKLYWEYDFSRLGRSIEHVCELSRLSISNGGLRKANISSFPELVRKCYSPTNLARLVIIKETIKRVIKEPDIRNFLELALTATLRTAAKVATGWPYIAPTKLHERSAEKDGLREFCSHARRMFDDLMFVRQNATYRSTICKLIQGDARDMSYLEDDTIDLAITSPPYLNNYDYADRTRLEMYFFGLVSSWGEITTKVRTRLIMSATTQINRTNFDESSLLSGEIRTASFEVYSQLLESLEELGERRKHRGGKKNYDILVAGYFNDMLKVLKEVHRALKPGADFVLVLGDSAPYGVHIPTETYLGQLGLGIGFSNYRIEPLRTRGDKWAKNPQRHKVALRESILTLSK